ncbi:hypothetical protein T484DRAFT_1808216 [Baffinella frigidus]|nr:hypothetical protein T484DRAFT_1808216 [Cryptophyta sp. CCMP2293]
MKVGVTRTDVVSMWLTLRLKGSESDRDSICTHSLPDGGGLDLAHFLRRKGKETIIEILWARQGEEAVLRQPGMPHEHFASIISAISKHDRTGILPALLFKMTPKAASNSLSGHQKTPPDDDLSRLRFRGILSTLGSQHHKTEAFSPGCLAQAAENIIFACASFRRLESAWSGLSEPVTRMAAQNIGRMDARSASRMLLGYASLGFAPPPQLAASLLEKATVDTRRTSSYDLIDIMWAVAVLDMHRHDPAVAAKALERIAEQFRDPGTEITTFAHLDRAVPPMRGASPPIR